MDFADRSIAMGAGEVRRVAIVGKARLTREYAPFVAPPHAPPVERGVMEGWDVWTMNEYAFTNGLVPTGMFEMHEDALGTERYSDEYKAWLRAEHPFPIWMHERDKRIPASVALDWYDLSDRFIRGVWRGRVRVRDLYSSTVCYALAQALRLGYEQVHLFGVELSVKDGFQRERDMAFWWMGQLEGRGVEVRTHKLSGLFLNEVYGVDNL